MPVTGQDQGREVVWVFSVRRSRYRYEDLMVCMCSGGCLVHIGRRCHRKTWSRGISDRPSKTPPQPTGRWAWEKGVADSVGIML